MEQTFTVKNCNVPCCNGQHFIKFMEWLQFQRFKIYKTKYLKDYSLSMSYRS